MTSLIRLMLILIVTCASAIAAIWLVGQTQPLSRDLLYTNPNGTPCIRPCLLGIRPGETSQAEAVALLRAHPLTHAMLLNIEGDIFHDDGLGIILNRDMEGRVASIRLAKRDMTTLGEASVIDQAASVPGMLDFVATST